MHKTYGLVGRHIAYSFSQQYFSNKFAEEDLKDCTYENFDLDTIDKFPEILKQNPCGLNVTIPYKESVLPFLHAIDPVASTIGAVNTIRIREGIAKGFNTDYLGFRDSLKPLLKSHHKKALILGSGGAAKAVVYGLNELDIESQLVSRSPFGWSYEDLNERNFGDFGLIINSTPLGTFPDVQSCPPLPYHLFTSDQIAYDLIYNPTQTTFLKKAAAQGALTKNGYEMLVLQAEAAWDIWNS